MKRPVRDDQLSPEELKRQQAVISEAADYASQNTDTRRYYFELAPPEIRTCPEAERDARIIRHRTEGRTYRRIADEEGMEVGTVIAVIRRKAPHLIRRRKNR